MPTEKFINSGLSTLTEDLDTSETGIDVADGSKFPSTGNFRFKIDDEIFLGTSRSGNTITCAARPQEGTTAATHLTGAPVKQGLTAASMANNPRSMTTKGDLETLDSSGNVVRVGVGPNGQIPIAASGETGGLKYSGTGPVYIGDDANADNTLGLTVNQGAAVDQILSLKGSDIAHGVTTIAETDTFAFFKKSGGIAGGLSLVALSEDVAALILQGIATSPDTTKGSGGYGALTAVASKKSGTGLTTFAAGDNLFLVSNHGTVVFIVSGNGDIWTAGSIVAASNFVNQAKWGTD